MGRRSVSLKPTESGAPLEKAPEPQPGPFHWSASEAFGFARWETELRQRESVVSRWLRAVGLSWADEVQSALLSRASRLCVLARYCAAA